MSITLEKKGDSHKINLSKSGASQQLTVKVNLNWSQKPDRSDVDYLGFASFGLGQVTDLAVVRIDQICSFLHSRFKY